MIPTEKLRYYPYFAGVGSESLEAISEISDERPLRSGETLFQEGAPARFFYIVETGHVEITLELGSGKRVIVDNAVPGDILGWSTFLPPYTMRASASARRESKVIVLDAEKLREMCEKDHTLGYRVMKQVAGALGARFKGAITQIAAAEDR